MKATKIKLLSAVVLALALITGCTPKSNNNNPYGNGWWGNNYGINGMNPGCPTCTNGYVGAGVDTNSGSMVILSFAANTSAGSMGNQPSYVTGQLDVMSGIPCMSGGYGLPPGVYQLVPPSQGSPNGVFDGSLGQSITLLAEGPVQAEIQIPDIYVFGNTRVCNFPGMQGGIQVDAISQGGYAGMSGAYCGAELNVTDQVSTGQFCQ